MKTMKFTVSLEGMDLPPQDAARSIQDLVGVVLQNIMHSYAKNGLRKDERKMYYAVVGKMDAAVSEKAEEIQLEDDEVGFLRKCSREAQMIPNRLLERVEKNIDDIEDR